jgi:F-type H+-transporting ATPase subunit gamma
VATLRDIRRRISSVQNTRKITKAMEMVAAARLRRAQQRIEALRPYARDMVAMMMHLATYAETARGFPLLEEHDEERAVALLVMTGDRGLAGAFNANVLRAAIAIDRELASDGVERRLLAVGRKGIGSLRFRGYELQQTWEGLTDRPDYANAVAIAKQVIDLYVSGEVDRVRLLYNEFKSPVEQRQVDVTILPIPRTEVTMDDDIPRVVTYIFEPDPETIFERILPAYVEIAIFRALLESSASEQGARMTAMRNASESAEEMMGALTLELNRARQATITREILEVVAGANALG